MVAGDPVLADERQTSSALCSASPLQGSTVLLHSDDDDNKEKLNATGDKLIIWWDGIDYQFWESNGTAVAGRYGYLKKIHSLKLEA